MENLEIDAERWLDWNWNNSVDCRGKYFRDDEPAVWLSKYGEREFLVSWSLEGDGADCAHEFDGKKGVSTCSDRCPAAILGWATRRSRKGDTPNTSQK